MRKIIKNILNKMGVQVFHYKERYHYVPDYYGVKYDKKINISQIDEFSKLAKKVVEDKNTFLYYDRLYILWQAIIQSSLSGNYQLAEVGVWRGGSAYFICSLAKKYFPDSKIFIFDTFENFPDVIPEIDITDRSKKLDMNYEEVKEYLKPFPAVSIIKGRFQDAKEIISNEKFSFVHIDVDIYTAYKECLQFFSKKLSKNGIMVLDDYGFLTCPGAKKATDEFLIENKNGYVFFHLQTGQGILIKK